MLRQFCLLLVPISAFAGCNGASTASLTPVAGEVFHKSQPAAGARVTLHPESGAAPQDFPSGYPRGIVKDDGSFTISTRTLDDGAPPGNYVLLVEWPAVLETDPNFSTEQSPPDRLGGRYSSPEKSTVRVKIENQATKVPRLELE